MKKALLLSAIACASLSSYAQEVAVSVSSDAAVQSPPAKVDLNEGQILVGLSTSDDINKGAVGFYGDFLCEAGCRIPASYYAGLDRLQVEAIRFGLAQGAKMLIHSVKLYGYKTGSAPVLLGEQRYEKDRGEGWSTIEFDEPIAISDEWDGLLPVYEFDHLMNDWPKNGIGTTFSAREGSFYALGEWYTNSKDRSWKEWGASSYGSVCVQMICSSAPLVEYSVIPDGCNSPTVAMGQTFSPVFTVSSTSGGEVSSIGYTVSLDGETTTGTATFDPAILPGIKQLGEVKCELTAPAKAGALPLIFTINKINGNDVDEPASATYSQKIVSRVANRMSVVEEFTGIECGWCVRGWVGMEKVRNELPDKAAVIAIHQFNDRDAMYGDYYHMASFAGGAPACKVDRSPRTYNPYSGEGDGIVNTVTRFANLLPEVAIDVEAEYTDADKMAIEAHANTEFLTDLKGSELVFVLTADGLQGTTPLWKQSNFYAGYTPDYFGLTEEKDPELCQFCSGYDYDQTALSLVNNDVMIGSSWPSATEPNEVPAFTTTKMGETASSSCTLHLPTKAILLNAINRDAVYVTAMVIKADGTIANAARCSVAVPTGIHSVLAPAAEARAYDLSGRINTNANGIRIEGGKKVLK